MDINTITPCLMVKNEEYWIFNALRDLLKVFPNIVMLDTGSEDKTKEIAKQTVDLIGGGKITLIEENYGDDPHKIGNGRNVLRKLCETHWMFLVDGDEIWTIPQLENLVASEIPEGIRVCMAGSHNVEEVNGNLMKRIHDVAGKDILMAPDINWNLTKYPFEGYGLGEEQVPMEYVHYLHSLKIFCWHVRHTKRSPLDARTYQRSEKYGYFRYNKGHEELPPDWLGGIGLNNPYAKLESVIDA